MTQVVTFGEDEDRHKFENGKVVCFGTHSSLPKPNLANDTSKQKGSSNTEQSNKPNDTGRDEDIAATTFLATLLGIPYAHEIGEALHLADIADQAGLFDKKIGNSDVSIVAQDPKDALRPDAFKPQSTEPQKTGNGIVFFEAHQKQLAKQKKNEKKIII